MQKAYRQHPLAILMLNAKLILSRKGANFRSIEFSHFGGNGVIRGGERGLFSQV